MSQSIPMFKRLTVNVLLIGIIWIILAIAVEAALWATGFTPPSYVTPETYGNVNLLYRPNSQTRWRGNMAQVREFDTPIGTNSIVQFDREHAFDKPDNVYRVLFVGDSFVEALQVPLEKWFGSLLEAALNQDAQIASKGLRVEVIKLGGSGNGAIKEYELLRKQGLKYDPDLVITLFTDSNDLNDDWHYYRRVTGREDYKHVNARPAPALYQKLDFYNKLIFVSGSRLNRWMAFLITEAREKYRRKKDSVDAAQWRDVLGAYARPGSALFAGQEQKWKEAAGLTTGAHLKMAQETNASGGRYVVAFVDRPQTYRPDAYNHLFKIISGLEREVDLDRPAKLLKAVLGSRGVESIDLNEIFKERAARQRTGHYVYDGHWNEEGHRWAAEALLPYIKKRILDGKD
jgi:hypothetical protein